jgi:hypothetical protein
VANKGGIHTYIHTCIHTQMDVEDCAGMSTKIEQIAHRCKTLERALDNIANKLWEPEVCVCMCVCMYVCMCVCMRGACVV